VSALRIFDFNLDAVTDPLTLNQFCVHQEFHSLFSKDFLIRFGDFGIKSGA
jgi:hypothetical protein